MRTSCSKHTHTQHVGKLLPKISSLHVYCISKNKKQQREGMLGGQYHQAAQRPLRWRRCSPSAGTPQPLRWPAAATRAIPRKRARARASASARPPRTRGSSWRRWRPGTSSQRRCGPALGHGNTIQLSAMAFIADDAALLTICIQPMSPCAGRGGAEACSGAAA